MRLTAPMKRRRDDLPTGPEGPDVAFVLSGGGSLGAVQVGAARALLETGIRPDLLVGCSVGALNAAFLAADPTPERAAELEEVWRGVTTRHVFGAGRHRTIGRIVLGRDHVADPAALRALIRRFSPVADLAELAVPCHVVTTDLVSGLPRYWSQGRAEDVLSASACLPGLFPPVRLAEPDGTTSVHVDGGVLVPVPVHRAVTLGARRIYVLDVSDDRSGEPPGERMSALGVLLRSFGIARAALQAAAEPEVGAGQELIVLPHPPTVGIDIRDFTHTPDLMASGYDMARAFLVQRPEPAPAPPPTAGRPGLTLLRRRPRLVEAPVPAA